MNLIISAYDEKDKARCKELTECVNRNLANTDLKTFIHPEGKGPRTTYQTMFDEINKVTGPDDVNIIANSDIYFDETIELAEHISHGECYALTRWNVGKGKELTFEDTPGSQDVWIFRGPIKEMNADIEMGVPGCDNRIAYEIEQAGYRVFNPSRAIITHHLHKGSKSYTNKTKRIEPPYSMVPIIGMPKRIFHISLGTHQKAQIKALSGLGNYENFDWTATRRDEPFQYLLMRAIKKFNPELIWMQIQRPGIVTPEMVRTWREAGATVINWTGDVRQPLPPWYVNVGRECSMSLFTNDTDIRLMREHGCKADYLQIGYDEKVYFPAGEKSDCPEIVFFGNSYGGNHFPLSEMRRRMVKQLKSVYGDNFGLYGNGWKGLEDGNYNGDEVMEAKILRGCKIAINLSHFNRGRYTSDRMFRILGCGTMCISHAYVGMEQEFKNNVHLQSFQELKHLVPLINRYLARDRERKQIGINGYNLVKSRDTWAHRIKELEQWI